MSELRENECGLCRKDFSSNELVNFQGLHICKPDLKELAGMIRGLDPALCIPGLVKSQNAVERDKN